MKLHQIALRVADLDAAEAFYRDVLGADFVARFDPPGLLFFDFDGVRLLFETGATAAANSAVLYIQTSDIDAAVADLRAKGVEVANPHPIHKDEDGTFGPAGETEWMAFFEDPSGNTLAFATRRK